MMQPPIFHQGFEFTRRTKMMPRHKYAAPGKDGDRNGFMLLMVLIVIVVATMAVYSFTQTMVVMDDAAHLESDQVQTSACVDSGSEMIRLLLSQPVQSREEMGGYHNNPNLFQGIAVSQDIGGTFNFAVVATGSNTAGQLAGIRFGLTDESSRLNVNALIVLDRNADLLAPMMLTMTEGENLDTDNIAESLLLSLPGMNIDTAHAILDWIDEDDEPREFGAESETYEVMQTPYRCPNGPITSVDELLHVQGVTPELLFGADANRNGVLDADEQTRYNVTVDTPGAMGWSSYLTVYGSETNLRADGTLKVDVNTQTDMEALLQELLDTGLEEIYATYIVAYKISGQSTGTDLAAAAADADSAFAVEENNDTTGEPGGPWTADLIDEMDLTGGAGNQLGQILDLVDSTVTIETDDGPVTFESPFPSSPIAASVYLPLLMDTITTSGEERLPGRINLNTAPIELLRGIPILDEETIQAIIENRDPLSDDPNRRYETWLLAEGLVDIDTMRQLTPLLCGGGAVFRGQIVGYHSQGGAFTRAEIIVDAHTINPKIISYRNLSHLGRGFELSVLGQQLIDPGMQGAAGSN